MSEDSRGKIFYRLKSARSAMSSPLPCMMRYHEDVPDRKANINRLKGLMEAVHAEVHVVKPEGWLGALTGILKKKGIRNLLYAPETDIGEAMDAYWKGNDRNPSKLIPYDRKVEDIKDRLFEIEASITSAAGAVADIGAIILQPDEKEPRTMSLIPPIHIAVLSGDKIYNNLSEVISQPGWKEKLPTNLLLISGPSKTADIELTLAFGVHGPKEFVVIILD